MLSAKLIQMIEDHGEAIGARFLRRVRCAPEMPLMQTLPDSELIDRAQAVVRNLGRWLASSDSDWGSRYEALGRTRCHEGIPLHEVVRALQNLKETIIDFARDQGFGGTSVEVYAEEELEHMISRSFDLAVYHVVHGYEEAIQGTRTGAAA
jgi:hypothetical protein